MQKDAIDGPVRSFVEDRVQVAVLNRLFQPGGRLNPQPTLRRLPKAIQAILSNYRGAHVTSIPENAIPDVLHRLPQAG